MSFKQKLSFDPDDLESSDNVGSYLRSSDGTQITHTVQDNKAALDVKNLDTVLWDKIETTFPDSTSDLFSYYKDTVLVMTVLVVYDSSSKKNILTVEKTRLD